MSEHDRIGGNKVGKSQGRKYAGTSLLLAAVSLLGTSLGVSAATPVDLRAATARTSMLQPTVDKLAAVGSERKAQSKYESNQVKLKRPFKSNQIKWRSR